MARLLVTNPTRKEGGIYLLDTATAALERVHEHPSRGITRGPDGVYAVGNDGAIYHLDPESWKATLKAETGLQGCHDLRWFGDQFFLVASVGNWVVRLDRELRELDRMRIVESDEDICHANCLLQVNGQLLLTIFTLSPGVRQEKRLTTPWRTEGKVLRLDWERKRFEILYEPLCQPHSLVWKDERLYCCESFASELVVLSPAEKRKEKLCRLHGFVRGLVFTEGNAYLGVSHMRLINIPKWQHWMEPFRRWCGVVEMDPVRWRPKRRFKVPGEQVYDLLVL